LLTEVRRSKDVIL